MFMQFILYKCGGPRYRTRGGRVALVLETNAEFIDGAFVNILQGRISGVWTEWDLEGKSRNGDPADDLVEAIAEK